MASKAQLITALAIAGGMPFACASNEPTLERSILVSPDTQTDYDVQVTVEGRPTDVDFLVTVDVPEKIRNRQFHTFEAMIGYRDETITLDPESTEAASRHRIVLLIPNVEEPRLLLSLQAIYVAQNSPPLVMTIALQEFADNQRRLQ